ncbi:MAG: DUF4384 domain-containing protein [Blastocatellia bacterium]|nr:DUF4384 domain-containing protein [Blastocatellia bacterium]
MKSKMMFLTLALIAFAAFALPIYAQADDDVRGAFLTTRPKATDKTNNPAANRTHRRPKARPAPTPGPVSGGGTTSGASKKVLPRMGLGLTLFMRDSIGLAVRTDPKHAFRKGDHVRFLLETNTDGYLYIFNTTDGGPPIMIYPDQELDEAGNYIQAHVPFEIPSSVAAEERLRWLTFDQYPGAEKLYFVFTREPLAGAPIEDDLISFCRENEGKCPWHPRAELWAQIQKELSEPGQTSKTKGLGNSETANEHKAVVRGIGLNRDDPEPSLIMLSASSSKTILVTTLDLVHNAISLLDSESEEPPQ